MFRGMIGGDRFGQSEVKQQRVGKTESGREEERDVNAPLAQYAANRWSKNKPESKRGADHAHALRAIFGGGDVGDVGLCGRDVAAGDAVENSAGEKHPERRCESEQEKTDAGADDGQEENRPAAVLV